ncbi:MAG: phosphoglycerate dehydrogenase [Actinomycetia bacterium]|nr:phosphoglycerate dehydrogenase [Actinomycetes bacterium]
MAVLGVVGGDVDSVTTIWLPRLPGSAGELPAGVHVDIWTGGEDVPGSADEVEFLVVPFGVPGESLKRILHGLPRLKVIQLMSAGADHVLPAVPPGVTLCNARGAHTAATAEWAVGAIIAALRQFPRFALAQRDGRWDTATSDSVAGQHVLIVGYGSIGAAVERRLAGWEVTIDRVARTARAGRPATPQTPATPQAPATPPVHALDRLPALIPAADVVVILVPVVEETRNMVDARFLAAMKDGALLVNAARGAIVDTSALLAELTAGRLRAALDVTDPEPLPPGHPLWSAPGLLLTPHVGGAVREAGDRAYEVVIAQIARYVAGQPLLNVIGPRGY